MSRNIQADSSLTKRFFIMATFFASAIFIGSIAGDHEKDSLISLIFRVMFLGGLTSMAYFFVGFAYYCCPRCKRKTPSVKEVKPKLHYYCQHCNIEWDTGWRNKKR